MKISAIGKGILKSLKALKKMGNLSLLLLIALFLWLGGAFYTGRLVDWAFYSAGGHYYTERI